MAEEVRPAFGNRLLSDPDKVFEHNAWDRVDWGEEQERAARCKVEENASEYLPDDVREDYDRKASQHWDTFYQQHQNRFFKDRHWLFTEFPELRGSSVNDHLTMLEVGCGVGNTVFPILQVNTNPNLFIYCCDFAESAIKICQEHSLYDPKRCLAFQCDITSPSSLPVAQRSLDLVILIFVLSAIAPVEYPAVIARLAGLLKPGGMLLFRDYGELDMAQLRFKKGQCLSDKFYVRGDGTRVYFFTEVLPRLLHLSREGVWLEVNGCCGGTVPDGDDRVEVVFEWSGEVDKLLSGAGLKQQQLHVDTRLQVNRAKQLKMYRVWIQAKYVKPQEDSGRGQEVKEDTQRAR